MSGAAPTGDDATEEMQRIMGFGSFKSTKGTQVPGNKGNWGVASPGKEAEVKRAEGGSAGGEGAGRVEKAATALGGQGRSVEELERELKRVLGVPGAEKEGGE